MLSADLGFRLDTASSSRVKVVKLGQKTRDYKCGRLAVESSGLWRMRKEKENCTKGREDFIFAGETRSSLPPKISCMLCSISSRVVIAGEVVLGDRDALPSLPVFLCGERCERSMMTVLYDASQRHQASSRRRWS